MTKSHLVIKFVVISYNMSQVVGEFLPPELPDDRLAIVHMIENELKRMIGKNIDRLVKKAKSEEAKKQIESKRKKKQKDLENFFDVSVEKFNLEGIYHEKFKNTHSIQEITPRFFTQIILDSYTTNATVSRYLNSFRTRYRLITLKEFLTTLSHHCDGLNIFRILLKLCHDICPSIGVIYGIDAFMNCVKNPNFEAILAVEEDYHQIVDASRGINEGELLKKIKGFLVVQKGECDKFPDYYTILLICTRPGSFKSHILLGLYLYSLITNPQTQHQHIGILEVAGGHTNTQAFCAYDKFGFIYDDNINDTDCFADETNLPMSVATEGLNLDRIANVINGSSLKSPHELCGEFKPNAAASPETLRLQNETQKSIAEWYHEKHTQGTQTKRLKKKMKKYNEAIAEHQETVDKKSSIVGDTLANMQRHPQEYASVKDEIKSMIQAIKKGVETSKTRVLDYSKKKDQTRRIKDLKNAVLGKVDRKITHLKTAYRNIPQTRKKKRLQTIMEASQSAEQSNRSQIPLPSRTSSRSERFPISSPLQTDIRPSQTVYASPA